MQRSVKRYTNPFSIFLQKMQAEIQDLNKEIRRLKATMGEKDPATQSAIVRLEVSEDNCHAISIVDTSILILFTH
jgi:hypothetical protein